MITINAYKLNFKLDEPLAVSFHTFYYRESVLIELRYNDLTGYGEAAPFKLITGDSQKEVIEQLKILKELDIDPTKNTIEDLHVLLDERKTSHTLRAALDFAYHDLFAKIKGIPVYQLYTPQPKLVNNSVTVFIKDNPEETAQDAQKLYAEYPDLKLLKIKLKGEQQDIERAKAIKNVSSSRMMFSVDANQGFKDPKDAVSALMEIKQILENMTIVEEPCQKGDLDKLKYVTDHVQDMLIFADETVATVGDAKRVVDAKAAHGVNIKLQKAGGIFKGKEIAKLCTDNGLKIMVGCMFEGPSAIAAGVHFVVSTPDIVSSDLDSDLDMPKHEEGRIPFTDGKRIPSVAPGLGIAYDFEKIKQLQTEGTVAFLPILR